MRRVRYGENTVAKLGTGSFGPKGILKGIVVVKQFVRSSLMRCLGYSLFVAVVVAITNLEVLKYTTTRWFIFPSAVASGIAAFTVILFLAWKQRLVLAQIGEHQACEYVQSMKIINAVQMAYFALDHCTHVTEDIEHKKCRDDVRRELQIIASALGKGPKREIIPGNKVKAMAGAV